MVSETHFACQGRRGFTLIEVLLVIGIIAILAGFIAPTVHRARRSARQADCRSNLRQFGIALTVYRADHNGRNPDWMSSLYPKYIDAADVYVCKSDKQRGLGEIIPRALVTGYTNPRFPRMQSVSVTDFTETIDNHSASPRHGKQNRDIRANSYFYEFSAERCSWDNNSEHDLDGDGTVTWAEAKEWQLRYGDDANGGSRDNPVPYSTSRMPIIRCWHHYAESEASGYQQQGGSGKRGSTLLHNLPLTLNVAYAGNVFIAPPWWEGRAEPGDR